MKIAHVFIRMPVGGAEDLVGDILRTSPAGVDTRIVCLRELGKVGAALQEQFPGKVELLPWAPGKRFRLGAVLKLAHWLREQGIQLVHTHVYNAHVYGVCRRAPRRHSRRNASSQDPCGDALAAEDPAACAVPPRRGAHHPFPRRRGRICAACLASPPEKVRVFVNPVDAVTFHPAADRARLRESLGLGRSPRSSAPWPRLLRRRTIC